MGSYQKTPEHLTVLLGFLLARGAAEGFCPLPARQIAATCRISKRTALALVENAVRAGLISRRAGMGRRPACYRLAVPDGNHNGLKSLQVQHVTCLAVPDGNHNGLKSHGCNKLRCTPSRARASDSSIRSRLYTAAAEKRTASRIAAADQKQKHLKYWRSAVQSLRRKPPRTESKPPDEVQQNGRKQDPPTDADHLLAYWLEPGGWTEKIGVVPGIALARQITGKLAATGVAMDDFIGYLRVQQERHDRYLSFGCMFWLAEDAANTIRLGQSTTIQAAEPELRQNTYERELRAVRRRLERTDLAPTEKLHLAELSRAYGEMLA